MQEKSNGPLPAPDWHVSCDISSYRCEGSPKARKAPAFRPT